MSYWRRVDKRLIRKDILHLDLKLVKHYADKLREINDGKRSRPDKITHSYISFYTCLDHRQYISNNTSLYLYFINNVVREGLVVINYEIYILDG
ncbi:MAG: hypothetical protein QXE96_00855 [Candidatus Caldarchaeum sp.]